MTQDDAALIDALTRAIPGKPQAEVAERLGVTQGRISEWLGGKRAPLRKRTRLAIARYLRELEVGSGPAAALRSAAQRLRLLADELDEEARVTSEGVAQHLSADIAAAQKAKLAEAEAQRRGKRAGGEAG